MKNLKIEILLKLGFTIILFFVLFLGSVSVYQNLQLAKQTELIYKHPLQVRRAISLIEINVLNIRLSTRNMAMTNDKDEKSESLKTIEISKEIISKQFDVLRDRFLGSQKLVEEAYSTYMEWLVYNNEINPLAYQGKIDIVKEFQFKDKKLLFLRNNMNAKIEEIDGFAKLKSEELFENSTRMNNEMNIQLFAIFIAILLLSFFVYNYMFRIIRKPIFELTNAANSFHEGNINARSDFESRNEFGVLSNSFNKLADSIQYNLELNNKLEDFSNVLLRENGSLGFFRLVLGQLIKQTNSQIAAIYLLSSDKKSFCHFNSIGLDLNSKKAFDIENLEGEFGAVISLQSIQHVKNINNGTLFKFEASLGSFTPNEMITIPIISNNELIAIITLASISDYNKQSLEFIGKILDTLSARIEGVLAHQKLTEFSKQLAVQNTELAVQKNEMMAQASELNQQNVELEAQKTQLSEASRLKTHFLSNMSHELRTPLNSVIALSGVLNRKLANQIPEEEYSYLEVIERNGKHLLSLINDILDISRIESGREEVEITRFDINALIADVVSMIDPQAKQKKLPLVQITNEGNFEISNDRSKCLHIIQNVIGNAVKFTQKGKVEVSASQNNENIIIKVRDTGIGIAESNLAHIFDEFRQADGSTSRKFGGNGLGLAIAKKYSDLLGGTISVSSVLDQGTEFTIVLPVFYKPKSAQPIEITPIDLVKKPTQLKLETDTSLKTILLVDDSKPVLIQMRVMLEESGYKTLEANNGAEALKILENFIPDAIILDLMMPDIDGFEVLRLIRENEKTLHVPVLILSAKYITKEELIFLKHNNIHKLIQKGDVNREDLLKTLAKMVNIEIIEAVIPIKELPVIVGKPKVLVVEDNADNMITIKALLDNNFEIIEAINGNDGIAKAKKQIPDLILMDIALPELDGIEAFKRIRNDSNLNRIPVIALTASVMINDKETILSHGFDGYISKPIDDKVFFITINEVLYGN
jgi:signal transduction histidine kinase/DNA-binding response OmpR family regulator/HAMP domain-containing protein